MVLVNSSTVAASLERSDTEVESPDTVEEISATVEEMSLTVLVKPFTVVGRHESLETDVLSRLNS